MVGGGGVRKGAERIGMHFRSLRCWQTVTLNTVEDTLLKTRYDKHLYIKERKKKKIKKLKLRR